MSSTDDEQTNADRLRQVISGYDAEALIDVLLHRRARIIAQLRKAIRELRADIEYRSAAHDRLETLITARTTAQTESHRTTP